MVFDLMGHRIHAKIIRTAPLKARIDLSGNVPGIYFVRLKDQKRNVSRKVAYFPH